MVSKEDKEPNFVRLSKFVASDHLYRSEVEGVSFPVQAGRYKGNVTIICKMGQHFTKRLDE